MPLLKTFKQISTNCFASSAKTSAFSVVIFISIILFFASCAQVVMPGGGKKDITPPKVVKYTPDSAQLNFNAKAILINFDEFIQLKDLNSQLIISPPLKTTPEITVKGKSLNIVFDRKDTLKSNTTYCISFGNAVQDITENNPIDNFKYIFSTGSFIDSSTVKGKVQNGFNHTVEKGILVMLYSNFDDSIIYKHLPDYFAKTKDDGTFQINNVKEGKYKLMVLKDGNANYKYDGEAESLGFIETPIDVTKKGNILIDIFQETPKKLYLKKNTYDSYGKIVFVFNKGADSLQINPINYTFKEGDVLLQYSKNKDSLTYWFRNIDKDVLKLQLKNGYRIMDTLEYKLISKEEALKSRKNKLAFTLLNNFNGNQAFDLNGEMKLIFNHTIERIGDDNLYIKKMGDEIVLKEDTLIMKHIFQTNYSLPDKENIVAPFSFKFKESTKYHLFIPHGTFTDFFGMTNDTIKIDFKTQEEKFYGTVKLKINIPEAKGQYILQLLDDKENLFRETIINAGQTINYDYLHPQQYKLKLIYDDNKNGKWDTGNYLQKIQPEKVIYYTGTITIRSNWDLDLEWKVTTDK